MSCGLTASTTTSAPLIASAFEVVASIPSRSVSSTARSSRRVEAMRLAQSLLRSPASSASPILPAPRIAILIAQAYEPGAIARQEVHAREPGPLLVRREQRVRLLRLDPAAPQRGGELDEAEIAREPALVAAEPLEADDADRPRPEAALALQPSRDRVGRVRPSAPRGRARESRTSADPRRVPSPSRSSWAGEKRAKSAAVGGALSPPSFGVAARITARSISRARLERISWPATARSSACATVAVRRGRRPRKRRVASPIIGSSANRRRNSEWSSSIPSTKRTCSTPASLCARTWIEPSGVCQACTCSSPAPPASWRSGSRRGRAESRRRRAGRGGTSTARAGAAWP